MELGISRLQPTSMNFAKRFAIEVRCSTEPYEQQRLQPLDETRFTHVQRSWQGVVYRQEQARSVMVSLFCRQEREDAGGDEGKANDGFHRITAFTIVLLLAGAAMSMCTTSPLLSVTPSQ